VIGLKSISAVAIAVVLVAIAAARGALGPAYLASLSGVSWFLIGLVASLACALIGVGWRFGVKSRGAVALAGGRPALVDEAEGARELPGGVQRALVLAGMVAILLGALGNHAAARIVQLPDELEEPSPSAYCLPASLGDAIAKLPHVEPPKAEPTQAGCALVRRAVALGYAKSLGSCAPKPVQVEAAPTAQLETCTRRRLDEPYLHYAARRLTDAFGKLGSTPPGEAVSHREDEIRAHLDHAEDLMADVRHAITGTPHASHHLWIDLPDPHPRTLRERFTGIPRCSTRFADLPLWPTSSDRSLLVEHVLGQLLFASRFGTPASCNDYTIHWDAPHDACAQLARDPLAFLARDGALASVRDVLDRRRRQLAIIELDRQLGRKPPVAPPAVPAIVSLQCLATDRAGKPTATTVTIDGEAIAVRDLHVPQIRTDADGPIDVYLALAALLAGTDLPGAGAPRTLDTAHFPLVHLDSLVDEDPFAGARWPLQDPVLVAVYPFEHHLRTFIDAFRRRYLPQRGRL
jgi:hypothetical protein